MLGLSNLSLQTESLLVLIVTSVTCAIIGSFLVLRKLSMISDAISHSVLLGIVLAFFITRDLNSPALVIGAAVFGVLTVFLIEIISASGLVKNDDAVGIVFPMFFALAVILITKFARNIHIDTDVVLMGEVILAPLNRIDIFGVSLPKALVQMSFFFIVNLIFIIVFFKELKLTTFDKEFAKLAGFSSGLLFYLLMTLTSMTSVVAFDAVGAILVVSFLISPPASAFLISKDLKKMILISVLFSLINSILGYNLAMKMNVSMSGMTATIAGITFFLTFLFNKNGLITSIVRRYKNKENFRLELMIMHIGNHEKEEFSDKELGLLTIKDHLNWKKNDLDKRAERLISKDLIYIEEKKNIYKLTEKGRNYYDKIKVDYGM